ncbi:MFS transporter [Pseudoflavonifractor sp. 60]|uniref:MFS transporter n=1 Tax=Pseudoflavonifractor sp. 60 TaxID=2304576 RepID=UPI00137145FB|nr:MFS transporter [Pseudoflavonifractor sp. 60]NBI68027.1 MFS transporter [Pseudoflavonifractor sp. 60]
MTEQKRQWAVRVFLAVLALTALANGFGNNIFSNYFNEAFHIDSIQRGFIEIPRESPGILCMVLVAALGFMGSLWMSVAAQALVLVGFVVLGWMSPSYGVMLTFLFVHSLGMHLFMPLNDAISMDLAEKNKVGTTLGKFKGVNTLFNMAAAVLVFFGFRTGFFSFEKKTVLPFALGAVTTAGAVVLLALMALSIPQKSSVKNHKLLFRRQYMPYYMVTLAYGCQKRIRIVFAPWVIINLLGQGADTVALLTIVTHFAGTLIAPVIGRILDRLGVRRMLWAEAIYIAVTFSVMGALAGVLAGGSFTVADPLTWLVFGAYVLCVLFEQFSMVHSYMMRSIALDPGEVTQTLSVGLSVDHVMAIIASPVMGLIWNTWGVEYVFYLAAASVVFQIAAAAIIRKG